MTRYHQTQDGSIIDDEGKVIFFSVERFVRDICEGDCCFICGAARGTKAFNDEHVLPDWILRKYRLRQSKITLPNQVGVTYASYLLPCCADCNSFLGENLELPMSRLIDGGHGAVAAHLEKAGPWLIFQWLCLVFIKTHLKDRDFRWHLDRRKGDHKIGDMHTWETFHHVHCVARSKFIGAELAPLVLGTLLTLPAQELENVETFDYGDLSDHYTLQIRLGDVAFVCALDDAAASLLFFENHLQRISGPLSPLQLREITAHIALLNAHLKDRPCFRSLIDDDGKYIITADLPAKPVLTQYEITERGELMEHLCGPILQKLAGEDLPELLASLRSGQLTFLFNDDGSFNRNSMVPSN
jgi:hypothetical protein